jgi:hypothetical protein
MKKTIKLSTFATGLLLIPFVTFAQDGQFDPTGGVLGTFLGNILKFANDVLIPFIFGIGFLIFVFGMFQFFIAGGANDEKKEKGKSLMIWATLGFVIILVFWGIVNIVAGGTGLSGQGIDRTLYPQATLVNP